MGKIFVNQVGFLPGDVKKAVLSFNSPDFKVVDSSQKAVFEGKTTHVGTDDISGEDVFVADFSTLKTAGKYTVVAGNEKSASFEISDNVYDKMMKDICIFFPERQGLLRSFTRTASGERVFLR